jgi:hypothetical protein
MTPEPIMFVYPVPRRIGNAIVFFPHVQRVSSECLYSIECRLKLTLLDKGDNVGTDHLPAFQSRRA